MFCVYVLRNASNGKYYIGYYGISGQRIALSTKDCFAKFALSDSSDSVNPRTPERVYVEKLSYFRCSSVKSVELTF
jgi:hypothetical protein